MKLLNTIKHYDISFFCWCMDLPFRPILARISRQVSRSADGYYYAVVALLMYLAQAVVPTNLYSVMIAAFVVERLLYFVLKLGLKRDRPASAISGFDSFIQPADKFSFPSGHTSAAFLFATFMSALYPALAPLLYFWAVIVGCSRLFLGVHFVTDVFMGATIGILIGNYAITFLG